MDKIIHLNETELKDQLRTLVRGSVEETLNAYLDAEADRITNATRYERSPERQDTRAGYYNRKLLTTSGEVELKMPKLRSLPFETAIIERYKRRESSVEEALIEMYLAGVSVAKGRGYHRGALGNESISRYGERAESESLRPHRDMAQSSAIRRLSLRISGRHLSQTQLGRKLRERVDFGGAGRK